MLEQLKYKNHLNEIFEFGKNGIYVNTNNLHDYSWDSTKKGNRISAFEQGVQTKKLPVIILCETAEQGIAARNKLFEVVEKDVRALKHGQIIVGDYYYKCFVTQSTKANYLTNKRYITITLTLTSDFPYWVKETINSFYPAVASAEGLDFPMDYAFDYSSSALSSEIINTGFIPSNFRMIIYGSCTNPTITIGEHIYQVNCTIGEGEYLTIDSTKKKIYITSLNGTITNKFNSRNKDSYIFEKIPEGKSHVTWVGEYGFDIILLEERSEPKWT